MFFTDPRWPTADPPHGRVWARAPDGTLRLVADDFWAPNGIVLDVDGETLIVVENGHQGEHHGFVRLHPDGARELFAPGRMGDGGALDVDGRIYMAGGGHVVTVYEPDGTVVEVLQSPGRPSGEHQPAASAATTCARCSRSTPGRPGHVYCWTGMPTPGLALHPSLAPAAGRPGI